MPTVTRFLRLILLAGAVVAAAVLALAYLVGPTVRPLSEPVDGKVLAGARRIDVPAAAPTEPAADATDAAGGTDGADAPPEGRP